MDDFKAGFETGHRNRFTRSGAIRMPRSVRLSLFADGSGLRRVPPITAGV